MLAASVRHGRESIKVKPVLCSLQVISGQSWRRRNSCASQATQCPLQIRHPCSMLHLA